MLHASASLCPYSKFTHSHSSFVSSTSLCPIHKVSPLLLCTMCRNTYKTDCIYYIIIYYSTYHHLFITVLPFTINISNKPFRYSRGFPYIITINSLHTYMSVLIYTITSCYIHAYVIIPT